MECKLAIHHRAATRTFHRQEVNYPFSPSFAANLECHECHRALSVKLLGVLSSPRPRFKITSARSQIFEVPEHGC
jgi:hypothetical protein